MKKDIVLFGTLFVALFLSFGCSNDLSRKSASILIKNYLNNYSNVNNRDNVCALMVYPQSGSRYLLSFYSNGLLDRQRQILIANGYEMIVFNEEVLTNKMFPYLDSSKTFVRIAEVNKVDVPSLTIFMRQFSVPS
jgi:hypothetical protein